MLTDWHDYAAAEKEEDRILNGTNNNGKENEKRCSYCHLPLKEGGGEQYYRQPLFFDTAKNQVQLDATVIYGHPSCIAARRIDSQNCRYVREMHDLHTYLRTHYNYQLPIIRAPHRELLTTFCGSGGLSIRAFERILKEQTHLVQYEFESFYVSTSTTPT